MLNLNLMKRSYVFLRNISSNFITQIILFIISFFTIPLIFIKFGSTLYGIYTILNTIPVYLTVLDFGLTSAFVKYLAEDYANKKKLNSLIVTAFVLYSLISVILALSLFLASNILISKFFNIPKELHNITFISLRLSAISFFLASLGSFLAFIPQALHRFEIYNIRNLILGILTPILTIILLIQNKGIIEIMWLYISLNLFILIIYYFMALNLLPPLSFKFTFSLNTAKKLINFGLYKFITNISSRMVFQLNNLLIAVFLPINYVSYYAIPSGMALKGIDLLSNITTPVFPLASELHSLNLKEKLTKLYKNSVKAANLLMFPFMFFIFIFSYKLIALWINIDTAIIASPILKILSIAFLICSFSGIPSVIAEGIGRPKITMFYSLIANFLYLLLALLLIPKIGIIGAALAILISSLLQVPIFIFHISKKYLAIKGIKFYYDFYAKPALIALVTLLPFILLGKYLISLWSIAIAGICYMLVFLYICLKIKIIDKENKETVLGYLSVFGLDKNFNKVLS